MKVVVGCFYHETNTFNPFPTKIEDFVLVEEEEMLSRFGSTDVFLENDITIIPSIYATALSSGEVQKEAYRFFADKIINTIKNENGVDGIWLHLHGSMVVNEVGSGELALMKEIRELVGEDIPIALTLDIHANLPLNFHEYVNIVRNYRTVPHEDQLEVEKISAQALVNALKSNTKINPSFIRLPMMICGEKALGSKEPLKSIFEKLNEMESRKGISQANYFICHAWSDTENTTSSVMVIPESELYKDLADKVAEELAIYVFNKRQEFTFDAIAVEPKEAIEMAVDSESQPVFISDSGDNTTAGAIGMNTELLGIILNTDLKNKKVVVAAIYDTTSFDKLNEKNVGEEVEFEIGTNLDKYSKLITVKGVLKSKGDLLGYLNATEDKVGDVCTVSVKNVDIVIANKGNSFITIGHFTRAGLNIEDYDIVVVKQGYLFPELSKLSKLDILALSAGATYQILEKINYENRQKPLFPMEKETKLLI